MTSAGASAPRDRALGEYQLLAKLATGGMAEIFLARKAGGADRSFDEVVVVKRILPHLADDEHFVTMFRDEANLASQLVHPNVCRVHKLGQADGVWFIVMEYLHGVALSRMLSRMSKQRQFLDVRAVAGLIEQACSGLHHAHQAKSPDGLALGVVHRDVSPPNILITTSGEVKLLDFGIAKARGASSKTRTGTVKGKNAYMSPEQILGKPLDRRSDVFALGAVMYELLAVKRLFHRESDFLTFKAITEEPLPDIRDRRPDLPPAMVAVLTRALAREPSGRFTTCAEMAEAVRAAIAPLGGAATPQELALIVGRDFADELAAKEDILAQARKSAMSTGDTEEVPTLVAGSSGQLGAA
ncbi:MAG: serine/threonine protein kinase, partial [Deltaproteobacteria bacterium]|nr:serine/threonine protein kinase [Kofleriaceae bacterium]